MTLGYDLAGRPTTVSQPDPASPGQTLTTTTVYDSAGRTWKVTNPKSETVKYHYDGLDRVDTVTDPLGLVTGSGYDWAGRRTDVTDPLGHTSRTAYTAASLVDLETNPAGRVTDYGYDNAGGPASVVNPRGTCTGCPAANYTTSTGYDLDDNVTTVTDQLGHTTNYGYDKAGIHPEG